MKKPVSRCDVPAWGGVRYVEMYPGVDLELSGTDGQLLPRLVCHANCQTALQQVRLQVEGADALQLITNQLVLTTVAGDFVFPSFTAVTTDSLNFTTYSLTPYLESNTVSFHLSMSLSDGPPSQTLTHPLTNMLYGTFLGGSGEDYTYDVTIDSTGNAYLTGFTFSTDFPTTPGPFDPTHNGPRDAFVVKLNPDGSDLVYATFLGGDSYDEGLGITVDEIGAVYITGITGASNFPITSNAYDPTPNGYEEAFITKLNPIGNGLIYSTFLGGNDFDGGFKVIVDETGHIYVGGYTFSSNFPVTLGAFDTTANGNNDTFVVKFNPTMSGLIYGTYIGGETHDYGITVTLDEMGSVYISGTTLSYDFPTTPGAFDTVYNNGNPGESDGFLVKLNPTGSNLDYATFLGGSNLDSGRRIAVDGAGYAYVTGNTNSPNFPTTPGAYDRTIGGSTDVFVVKFNPTGSDLSYGTFLGGGGVDEGFGIAVNSTGYAYVAGRTSSLNFPVTPGAYDPTHNGSYDAFMVTLNPAGSDLVYATFLGGSGADTGFGIARDGAGSIYLGGRTASSDFPTTPGALDTTYNGGDHDAFVIKLASVFIPVQAGFSGTPTTGIAPLNVAFTNLSTGDFDNCLWVFGDGGSSNSCADPGHLFTMAGSYTVTLTASGLGGTDTLTQPGYITVHEPAVAGFDGTPTSGVAPLNVAFTNLSTGDFDSCLWQFGDGVTSANCNDPEHTFMTAGTYTVTLTVSGLGGVATVVQPAFITVYEGVQAEFAAAPTSGHTPLLVQFTNLSTGDFSSCTWDFGDGTGSTACENTIHTYEMTGVYTVTLTISGPGGTATETKTDYVIVEPRLLFLPLLTRPQ